MKKNLLILLALIIVVGINLFFKDSLPEKLTMQVAASGNPTRISTIYFMFIGPLILILDYIYTLFEKENYKKPIIIAGVVIVLDIITIIMNI